MLFKPTMPYIHQNYTHKMQSLPHRDHSPHSLRKPAMWGQNVQLSNVTAGGTYSYH